MGSGTEASEGKEAQGGRWRLHLRRKVRVLLACRMESSTRPGEQIAGGDCGFQARFGVLGFERRGDFIMHPLQGFEETWNMWEIGGFKA